MVVKGKVKRKEPEEIKESSWKLGRVGRWTKAKKGRVKGKIKELSYLIIASQYTPGIYKLAEKGFSELEETKWLTEHPGIIYNKKHVALSSRDEVAPGIPKVFYWWGGRFKRGALTKGHYIVRVRIKGDDEKLKEIVEEEKKASRKFGDTMNIFIEEVERDGKKYKIVGVRVNFHFGLDSKESIKEIEERVLSIAKRLEKEFS